MIGDIFKDNYFERKTADERVEEAVSFLSKLDLAELAVGKYPVNDHFLYNVQEYITRDIEDCKFEWHKNHIDIQWIVKGAERIDIEDTRIMEPLTDYNPEKDVQFLVPTESFARTVLTSGAYVVVYPQNAHRPCAKVGEKAAVKKVVAKILI